MDHPKFIPDRWTGRKLNLYIRSILSGHSLFSSNIHFFLGAVVDIIKHLCDISQSSDCDHKVLRAKSHNDIIFTI